MRLIVLAVLLLALPAVAAAPLENKIVEGAATFPGGTLTLTLIEHPTGGGSAHYSWGLLFEGGGYNLEQKTAISCGQDSSGKTNPSYNTSGCTVAGYVRNQPNIPGDLLFQVTVYKAGVYGPLGWVKATLWRKGAPGQPRTLLYEGFGQVSSGGFIIGPGIQP